jgi:radical SAM family uncharacterized protein
MQPILERILSRVQKPSRYTGGEYNQIIKDKAETELRFALCFPDTYEIGMSNLGLKILYGVLNNMSGVWCERVFAPWGDMEEELRRNSVPLYALESGDELGEFDIIGFSLGYEMAYTNVLNMLDLAKIPLRSSERGGDFPLVVAGGTCAYNPEPLADFIDIFLLGEGEDLLPELVSLVREMKNSDRLTLLRKAAEIEGVYVPSLYSVEYNDDGTVKSISPQHGAPAVVTKRIVQDFENSYFPTETIIPSTEIVHDRTVLELFRGCIRGCRFCQAGYVYRPVRSRGAEKLTELGISALKHSGYQEVGLSSLSTSDYRGLKELCDGLLEWCEPKNIGLSLPSLRADNFSMEIMERVQKVRKSGLTFAPEAGSQRLRDVVNKNVTEEDILNTCRTAFEGGRNSVKLYFMLGLPTETDDDVLAISDLAYKIVRLWKECAKSRAGGVRITLSTACFVPKPMTPFQWEAQVTTEEYERRVILLREAMRLKAISYNWHDAETSLVEAVLARGDRRLGSVIEEVQKTGGKMESWSEYFSYDRWRAAFEKVGLDPGFYASRERSRSEILPWSHLSAGVTEDFLWSEREAAYRGEITPDCRTQCTGCGADILRRGGKCDD